MANLRMPRYRYPESFQSDNFIARRYFLSYSGHTANYTLSYEKDGQQIVIGHVNLSRPTVAMTPSFKFTPNENMGGLELSERDMHSMLYTMRALTGSLPL